MDISKLQIDRYKHIKTVNFPEKYNLNIQTSDETSDEPVEVVIYYIDELRDIDNFVELVKSSNLPSDNRAIMIYEKGRKDGVNRDGIIRLFKEGPYNMFKLRKPALCSLSNKLSAFVQSYEDQ